MADERTERLSCTESSRTKRTGSYLIAEVGCEHRGDLEVAKKFIDQAVYNAGADCVKFQLFYPEEVGPKVWNKIKRYHLDAHQMEILKGYCTNRPIDFLCSAFGLRSLHALHNVGCKAVKIPAPCNEWDEYLAIAHKLFDRLIISTGMTEHFNEAWNTSYVSLLQCTSAYPCAYNQVNLNTLALYDGLSDHTPGILIPPVAVGMGAKIIEKHVTMGDGPDAHMAISMDEFGLMRANIRRVEEALGDGEKRIEDSEKELLWRKTL